MKRVHLVYGASLALTLVSLLVPKLALFSVLLSVIALAASTRDPDLPSRSRGLLWGILAIAILSTGRFILVEAMPGIIEARGRDSSAKAVSFLREILFAEDALRKNAMIDPDADGIGSAGFLGELAGTLPARGKAKLPVPPLSPRHEPRSNTRTGPALLFDGYYYAVCLPKKDGGMTAEPSDPVDEEKAERRFLAFAWPASKTGHVRSVFVLDEHEAILEDKNEDFRVVGPDRSPSCDDALSDDSRARYAPWRKKKPRDNLPGDKP